jgi:ATP-dependent Lon protease
MIEKEKQQIQEKPIESVENPTLLDQEDGFLALLPLKNVVILPKSILPIIVGRKQSIQAVEYALKQNKTLFITAQKDSKIEEPTEKDVFHYGTRSTILQVMRMPNGALKILAEGICRAEIVKIKHSDGGFIGVMCKDILTTDLDDNNIELEAIWRQLKELYTLYTKLNEKVPADLLTLAKTNQEMDYVVDTIAVHIHLSFEERQTILETASLKDRMIKLCEYLTQEIEILKTEQRIKGRIQQQVEKSQREYYLTEQIKAIQKELGREDQATELNEIQEKITKLKLSPEAREKVEKEMRRLEQMPPLSSEAVVSRNYVDWIISLPWDNTTKDTISIDQAEKILNRDHAGLHKVKERIIEFLAAKKFSKKIERSPIICLVGPPGVGKTSLARSIADSLGRTFARISLGGIRDEAEIRGHRRTYIGALPGKIIHAIKKAGTMNPVILLDEIDKISKDIHGDPAAALLEVLDPEQNKGFVDHFIDIDFDLSNVMFLTTANTIDDIPSPLFDRMEIIPLSGYTEQEKIEIARNFLIPKALKEYDLNSRQFILPEQQLRTIITKYTQEAGVRQLERIITKLMRKAIQMLLKDKILKSVTVSEKRLRSWLGTQKFKKMQLKETKNRIGLAVGLAWTEFGGDILEIEATAIPGKGVLTLTGQLGDVMQESAQAALSYVRSRAQEIGLKNSFNSTKDIHVHIPEGATPKDGPSAGITICTSVISALTKIATQPAFAMTGEITLQGRVLPVGGLKEKLLAAKQHGIQTIILPKENYDDIQEILKETDLGTLQFIFVNTMDDVLEKAFIKNPLKVKEKTKYATSTKTTRKRKK